MLDYVNIHSGLNEHLETIPIPQPMYSFPGWHQLIVQVSVWRPLFKKAISERDFSYMVGGNVNWYNHYGEQYGSSLKN